MQPAALHKDGNQEQHGTCNTLPEVFFDTVIESTIDTSSYYSLNLIFIFQNKFTVTSSVG